MSGKGKRRNTNTEVRDWATDKEEKHTSELEEEHSSEDDKETKKSVADFDREEVKAWETKQVKELSMEDLIKVLICRGEKEKNPTVASDAIKTLKKINMERIPRKQVVPSRGNYRGGYRGGYQRNMNNDDRDRNSKYERNNNNKNHFNARRRDDSA